MSQQVVDFLSRPAVWLSALGIAGGLALYWALRGSAPGQRARGESSEGEGAPSSGYRDRMAAFAVVGLLLVAWGAYEAMAESVPWSLPLFGGGFGLVLYVTRVNRRYRHVSPSLRRLVLLADAALTGSLVAGILVVANVLAFKYGDRPLDFTQERVFTLHSLTVNQLRNLDKPVRFTAFYGRSRRARRQLDRVVQLLELYKAESPSKISFDVSNPFGNPVDYEELVQRAPGVAVTPGGGILVEYGQGQPERLVIHNNELFGAPATATGPAPAESSFRGEGALTSALIRLREAKKAKVAFITGHGEPSVHETDPSKLGLGLLRTRLESVGAQVIVHNLQTGLPPSDTALAIVSGIRSPFLSDEVERLRTYASGGGRVLLLLDGRSRSGLEEWLASYNVELGPELVLDARYNLLGRATVPRAPVVGDSRHPIVEPLLNEFPAVPGASPMTLLGQPGPGGRTSPRKPSTAFAATAILHTSPDSWAAEVKAGAPIVRNPEKDLSGPFVVAAAVTDAPHPGVPPGSETPRLVVFSSPMMGDNWFVSQVPANLDLIVNAANWLRGRSDLQGIAPTERVALRLSADPALRARLVVLPTVMAFAILIGLGVATYLARRA